MAARSILLGLTLISYVQAVVCCLGFALRVEKYKQVEEKRRWPFKAPQARRQDRWDCQCLGQQVWTLKLFWLLAEMLREGGVGGGGNSIQKIERCFCQAGRVRITATGGKKLVQAAAKQRRTWRWMGHQGNQESVAPHCCSQRPHWHE